MLGAPLAMIIGNFVAGWLNQLYGWQVMFMLLGPPGLVLALIARLSLKEPRRARVADRVSQAEGHHSLKEVVVTLWTNTSFRYLWLCFSVTCFFSYGLLQWLPTFFVRSFGLGTAEVGAWIALIYGLGGMLGTYLGGVLATRYAAHNEPLQLRAMATLFSSFGILMAGLYLSPNKYVAFGFCSAAAVGGYMTNGPLFGVIQTLVPQRMRAMSMALIYLFANLVGLGLGPLTVGALSDLFRPWAGEESLRYALLALCPGYLWGAWYLWRGAKTVIRDVEAVQRSDRCDPTMGEAFAPQVEGYSAAALPSRE
jgi:MFS family permease